MRPATRPASPSSPSVRRGRRGRGGTRQSSPSSSRRRSRRRPARGVRSRGTHSRRSPSTPSAWAYSRTGIGEGRSGRSPARGSGVALHDRPSRSSAATLSAAGTSISSRGPGRRRRCRVPVPRSKEKRHGLRRPSAQISGGTAAPTKGLRGDRVRRRRRRRCAGSSPAGCRVLARRRGRGAPAVAHADVEEAIGAEGDCRRCGCERAARRSAASAPMRDRPRSGSRRDPVLGDHRVAAPVV